jgi:circularin A/uberolysin family circular bacteriocin
VLFQKKLERGVNYMLFVAAVLGIPEPVAESIVSIILGASTLATILVALAGILAGGISAVLAEGSWTAFVTAVKSIVKKRGVTAAVLW